MTSKTITVNVKFFASLRETLGIAQTSLTLPSECTVEILLNEIKATYRRDNSSINVHELRVAVNQQIVEFDQVVRQDDEVAIFPPITGG